jgi:hypothetical protein
MLNYPPYINNSAFFSVAWRSLTNQSLIDIFPSRTKSHNGLWDERFNNFPNVSQLGVSCLVSVLKGGVTEAWIYCRTEKLRRPRNDLSSVKWHALNTDVDSRYSWSLYILGSGPCVIMPSVPHRRSPDQLINSSATGPRVKWNVGCPRMFVFYLPIPRRN